MDTACFFVCDYDGTVQLYPSRILAMAIAGVPYSDEVMATAETFALATEMIHFR